MNQLSLKNRGLANDVRTLGRLSRLCARKFRNRIYNRYDNIYSVYIQGFNLRIYYVRTKVESRRIRTYCSFVLINSLFIDRKNQFSVVFNIFYLQKFKFSNIEPIIWNIHMFFFFVESVNIRTRSFKH